MRRAAVGTRAGGTDFGGARAAQADRDRVQAPARAAQERFGRVDTPLPQHARNLMDSEPKLPDATTIDPDQVAAAILGSPRSPGAR